MKGVKLNSLATAKLHSINLQKPITVPITDRLSVRLYADSRPHCLETASLHKGLVLMLDNKEVIEEGMGFGVPVAKYRDKTHFSSLAYVSIQGNNSIYLLTKAYVMDAISRKKFWCSTYINDDIYTLTRKTFERLYLRHKNVSPVFNSVMALRNMAKIKTEFQKVESKGAVTVNYEIQPSIVKVRVDFSDLTLDNCEELLVLNEQGSDVFDKYSDSSCLKLAGSRIGGWDSVNANEACLSSSKKQISFCLRKNGKGELFRGRENIKRRFSWAGLNYSLQPNQGVFDYEIRFDCGDSKSGFT